MNEAFLIIDMQKGCREFCKSKREFDDTVEYIRNIIRPVVSIEALEYFLK